MLIKSAVFLLMLTGGYGEGLRCYSCFGTGGGNECEQYETYETAMDGKNENLKKNCTAPHNRTCFIEVYALLGQTVSHIRDCNDGFSFSFNSSNQNDKGAYNRLFQLLSNNETSCVWDGQHQVCLSKCNTDFCNGPQLVEKTNGYDVMRASSVLVYLFVVMSFLI